MYNNRAYRKLRAPNVGACLRASAGVVWAGAGAGTGGEAAVEGWAVKAAAWTGVGGLEGSGSSAAPIALMAVWALDSRLPPVRFSEDQGLSAEPKKPFIE